MTYPLHPKTTTRTPDLLQTLVNGSVWRPLNVEEWIWSARHRIVFDNIMVFTMESIFQEEYEVRDGYYVISKDGKSRFDDGEL